MFKPYKNSLLSETVTPDADNGPNSIEDPHRKLLKANKPNLSMVSGLYLYTGTPPHGYGTQAPKVAETVSRAYSFNLKPNSNKKIKLLGIDVERMHWEKSDGPFPFDEIHGNFIPSEARVMVEKFVSKNCSHIDDSVFKVMSHILNTNSDILTKGKQTYCPFTKSSITAARAYKNMYEFFSSNLGIESFTCLEWIKAFFLMMNKNEISYKTHHWVSEDKTIYDPETKQRRVVKVKTKKKINITTKSKEETQTFMIYIATGFASYIKHKERGKKDRRAIASANMILRMFLYIIEEFHLELAKQIEGATISIGGEEKKQKITNNMLSASLMMGSNKIKCQGTEDATKWNECLSPSLFALIHRYMFQPITRKTLQLPLPRDYGVLFQKIAIMGNFLLSLKHIQLGPGVTIQSESTYSRTTWHPEHKENFNPTTLQWYEKIEDKLTHDCEDIYSSPGMLMGMHNALSTIAGLIAANHRMSPSYMKVLTLRSSDDSMSLYIANNVENNKGCVERNRRNLGMLGINLSPDKTFFFTEGLGEYTSWYMDGKFVSQFGTETSSIRPKGINPPDDFYSLAKETSTALCTLTMNHIGASAKLRIGIDGIRRLWRITRSENKRNLSRGVLLLSDGGGQPWTSTNCHLEETSLRERFAITEEDKSYLLRVRNPNNPFAPEPTEEVTFSKEHGTLIVDTIEIPRTCFHFLKKSNRTFKRDDKVEESELERCNHEVSKLVNLIDPTTYIDYPTTSARITSHLSSIMRLERQSCDLSETENLLFEQAMRVLERLDPTSLLDRANELELDFSCQLNEEEDL